MEEFGSSAQSVGKSSLAKPESGAGQGSGLGAGFHEQASDDLFESEAALLIRS